MVYILKYQLLKYNVQECQKLENTLKYITADPLLIYFKMPQTTILSSFVWNIL